MHDNEFYSLEIELSKAMLALFNSTSLSDPAVKLIQRDLRQDWTLKNTLYQSHDILGRQLLKTTTVMQFQSRKLNKVIHMPFAVSTTMVIISVGSSQDGKP